MTTKTVGHTPGWFKVINGMKFEIHEKDFQNNREMTIANNIAFEEDADKIIEAVNSHDRLVAMNKELVEAARQVINSHSPFYSGAVSEQESLEALQSILKSQEVTK